MVNRGMKLEQKNNLIISNDLVIQQPSAPSIYLKALMAEPTEP